MNTGNQKLLGGGGVQGETEHDVSNQDQKVDEEQGHSLPPEKVPKPFLKWAGGKQKLLAQFKPFFPQSFRHYFEPFLGGGAVFFYLRRTGRISNSVYLFDNLEELVNAYRVVRDSVRQLLECLAVHRRLHSRDYYYEIRNLDRQTERQLSLVQQAARTIYLNKTCYNGLYRVNKTGQFNVPIGTYVKPGILQQETLLAASHALQGVALESRDFRKAGDSADKGDFIYFDPPYDPLSQTSNFTSYTRRDFRRRDQCDLAERFRHFSERGCFCMLSNSHTPFILELYKDFRIETVSARRVINSKTDRRELLKEVVILNY